VESLVPLDDSNREGEPQRALRNPNTSAISASTNIHYIQHTKHLPMLRPLILILLFISTALSASGGTDTFAVFFRSNDRTLTEGMQQRIDDAIYKDVISDRAATLVIGYADEVGNNKENLRISVARAQAVKGYLIHSGFRPERITLVTGRGAEGALHTANKNGYPRDRRVDIVKSPDLPPAPPAPATPPPPAAAPIDLGKVKVGEALKLDNIYFQGGTHEFLPGSEQSLEALYQSLTEHPSMRIKIEGHICCFPEIMEDGMDESTHTPALSYNRAKAVHDYLIGKGIAASRLECVGFGRRKPIYSIESTEEQRKANRRVEIRVLN
jgi:outer membrane protein OmpA-like peptidoglycan-associated protein